MSNPLEDWFNDHADGPGIWKWLHYFPAYDRHFSRFRGKPVTICEVGVYSGGSLDMWRAYFGEQAVIHGVDIQPACKKFERDGVRIHIGDQGDREFWKRFREEVPNLDILIDDGSHQAEHQIVTIEEMLPHLAPGGVYLCEDIHHAEHGFNNYINWSTRALNETIPCPDPAVVSFEASPFQSCIESVHCYPYVYVVEKRAEPLQRFMAPARGKEWIYQDPAWKP